jgi:Uma2 family endonuclease
MELAVQDIPDLRMGDWLTREEFLRRWEAMPGVKRAELIRGVVYMPSPTRPEHGWSEANIIAFLTVYKAHTPGSESASNTTWLMLENEAPQPDCSLWVLPESGGKARLRQRLLAGAPEFLAEVCLSSAAFDLHQKLEVYQEAGVQEYLALLIHEQEVRWHKLTRRRFRALDRPADGIFRSSVFPGLWFDANAFLQRDMTRVLSVLDQGVHSPEHAAFVKQLALNRRRR